MRCTLAIDRNLRSFSDFVGSFTTNAEEYSAHLPPCASSEEVPDRSIETFALDVPQSHVDATDGGGNAVSAEAAVVPVHVVVEMLGIGRIHADDGIAEDLDRLLSRTRVGPGSKIRRFLGCRHRL